MFALGIKHCGFRLSGEEDQFLWSWNESSGKINVKIDYEDLRFSSVEVNFKWWFKCIWK